MGLIYIIISPLLAIAAPFELIRASGKILAAPIAEFIRQWADFFA